MIALILNIAALIGIVFCLKKKKKAYIALASCLGVFIGLSVSLHVLIKNNPLKFYISTPGELTKTTCVDMIYVEEDLNTIKLETGEVISFEDKKNMFSFNEQFYSEDMIAYKLENIQQLKNKIYHTIAGVPLVQKGLYLEIMMPAQK